MRYTHANLEKWGRWLEKIQSSFSTKSKKWTRQEIKHSKLLDKVIDYWSEIDEFIQFRETRLLLHYLMETKDFKLIQFASYEQVIGAGETIFEEELAYYATLTFVGRTRMDNKIAFIIEFTFMGHHHIMKLFYKDNKLNLVNAFFAGPSHPELIRGDMLNTLPTLLII